MKRDTKEEAVRRAMATGNWYTHLELRRIGGTRFTARLFDLRAKGHANEKRFRNGGWQYKRVR